MGYTIPFLSAKMADIGIVTVYYVLFGLVIAFLFDIVLGKFDEKKYDKKSIGIIFGELIVHFFIIGIIVYILRNIIERIPSPVEGIGGFQHKLLKEIGGGVIGTTILIGFQSYLQDKINYCKKRLVTLKTTVLLKD
jgi:predicted PurR-regulated permease PerM